MKPSCQGDDQGLTRVRPCRRADLLHTSATGSKGVVVASKSDMDSDGSGIGARSDVASRSAIRDSARCKPNSQSAGGLSWQAPDTPSFPQSHSDKGTPRPFSCRSHRQPVLWSVPDSRP